MQKQSVLKHHAGLVDRMAERAGVDLEEEVLRGRLETGAISDIVLKCTACNSSDDCAEFLDSHSNQGSLPAYCRNARLFEKLGAVT